MCIYIFCVCLCVCACARGFWRIYECAWMRLDDLLTMIYNIYYHGICCSPTSVKTVNLVPPCRKKLEATVLLATGCKISTSHLLFIFHIPAPGVVLWGICSLANCRCRPNKMRFVSGGNQPTRSLALRLSPQLPRTLLRLFTQRRSGFHGNRSRREAFRHEGFVDKRHDFVCWRRPGGTTVRQRYQHFFLMFGICTCTQEKCANSKHTCTHARWWHKH